MISIGSITREDVTALASLRLQMFREMAGTDDPGSCADQHSDQYKADLAWIPAMLEKEQLWAWGARASNTLVGCCMLTLYDLPPKPWNVSGRYGYVSSIFTLPEYRRQGVATRMIQTALDWAVTQSIPSLTLHASPAAQLLYRNMGFAQTNEMRLAISQDIIPNSLP